MLCRSLRICLCILLISLGVFASSLGPSNAGGQKGQAAEDKIAARKFGDFRPDVGENLKATVELFAEELRKDPTSRACIIYYPYRYPALPAARRMNAAYAKGYLAGRGVSDARITTVVGGKRTEPWMELWIVPKGAEIPKPVTVKRSKKRTASTALHR